jgi:hypothetical protein
VLQTFLIMAAARDMLKLPAAPPAALLFSHRTISALAAAVQDLSAQSHSALPPCTPRAWPDDTRPLSSNQQQMWWLRELAAATAYNMPMVLTLKGAVDCQLLQQALDMLAARHEVLRMYYQDNDVGVMGVIAQAGALNSIPLACQIVESEAETAQVLQHEVNTPFDLGLAPPVRALLISLPSSSSSSSRHVLCISMHHIAGDGWSSRVLWEELSRIYRALVAGRVPELPPLPVQYSDYAAWQQEVLASDYAAQWRSYWREALLGAPALLQLPCDRPRSSHPSNRGATMIVDLPAELETALRSAAALLGVNLQAALLGTLQVRQLCCKFLYVCDRKSQLVVLAASNAANPVPLLLDPRLN